MFTYVRWKLGEPRESQRLFTLDKNHPAVTDSVLCYCYVCNEDFKEGDCVQLLALGGETEKDRADLSEGKWVSVLTLVLHCDCMSGKDAQSRLDNVTVTKLGPGG